MRTLMMITVALFGLAFAPGAAVAGAKKPFVATAVQTFEGREVQTGTIYVSAAGTRFEYLEGGRPQVKIILSNPRVMRILFPQDKVYMEVAAPMDTPTAVTGEENPCPDMEGLSCEKITDAKFGDLDVEQWRQYHAPSKTTSMVWWEPVRNLIVRQEFSDGAVMQLNLVGKIDFEGRETERWDISMARADGTITTAYQLVDTDLGIIVKDENPAAGVMRELRELKVMDSDANWFDVPADYRRVEPPRQPSAQ